MENLFCCKGDPKATRETSTAKSLTTQPLERNNYLRRDLNNGPNTTTHPLKRNNRLGTTHLLDRNNCLRRGRGLNSSHRIIAHPLKINTRLSNDYLSMDSTTKLCRNGKDGLVTRKEEALSEGKKPSSTGPTWPKEEEEHETKGL